MEYQIEGAPLPVVICQLEAGETMLTERGSMSWMTLKNFLVRCLPDYLIFFYCVTCYACLFH